MSNRPPLLPPHSDSDNNVISFERGLLSRQLERLFASFNINSSALNPELLAMLNRLPKNLPRGGAPIREILEGKDIGQVRLSVARLNTGELMTHYPLETYPELKEAVGGLPANIEFIEIGHNGRLNLYRSDTGEKIFPSMNHEKVRNQIVSTLRVVR